MHRRSALGLLLLVAIASALALTLPAAASAANFKLTLQFEGSGSGTIECEVEEGPVEACDPEYPEGTEIAFVADPDTGSEFFEWGEDCLGQGEECEVTMDNDKVVSAVFELIEVPLELQTEGLGFGEIECKVEGGPAEGCEFEYPFGTKIAFVAVAEPGSEFVEWDEDCSGAGPCEVTMDEEHFVSAVFGLKVALNIEVEGFGEGEVECEVEGGPAEACETEYLEGTKVKLVPVAETGSKFVEWTEECSGNGACELTVDEERFVGAVFEPIEEFELEVTVFGAGKVDANSGAIANCRESSGTCSDEYVEGTKVILTATADSGNKFEGWTGCDSEPSGKCEVTMSAVKSVEAEFAEIPPEEFALEVSVSGEGKVDANSGAISGCTESSGVCEDEYVEGTVVTLTATADVGNKFVKWTGCGTVEGNKCKVTMSSAKSVEAEFAAIEEFKLEVEVFGAGKVNANSGAILNCRESSGVCEDEYVEGTVVTLTATADSGNKFEGWTGCPVVEGSKCKVTMSSAKSVEAEFAAIEKFKLDVTKSGTGSGTVTSSPVGINCGATCSAEFEEGKGVTLTASASLGSEFVEWEGCDAEPSATKCEVTMDEDIEVIAVFAPEPPPSEFGLTVTLAGTGSGTVTSSPVGINCGIDCSDAYAAGTEVTLMAAPASGSSFAGWSGACSGAGACKVTMNQARSVTATFTKSSSPPPPPPPPGTAVVGRTAKVKAGKAALKLTCKGEGACKGSLKLKARIKSGGKTKNLVIGKASFSLAAGATTTLKVKLSGPAKTALAKGPLKAKVSGSGVAASTVKLKPANK
jgi:hypothetical protein